MEILAETSGHFLGREGVVPCYGSLCFKICGSSFLNKGNLKCCPPSHKSQLGYFYAWNVGRKGRIERDTE